MKYNKVLLFILLLSGFSFSSSAQCPPNIDFELGNTSVWNYYIGTCCPLSTPTSTAPLPGRHTLTTGAGVDPYGGFPIVSPGGGAYSMKLGEDVAGSLAEKARYYVHVPVGVSNYSLVYRYAVVVQNGGSSHTVLNQPRFDVNAYDSATGAPIACAQYDYNYSAGLPGFTLSGVGSQVYYKGWTTASVNLSGLGGSTIAIDFTSGDCTPGAHFGYGYLDMGCGLFSISSVGCDSTNVTLSAPDGFQGYTWYDSLTYTTVYGTTQTISTPVPAVATTYAVVLQPYTGFGCPDTLYTRVRPSHLVIHGSNDTALCLGNPITISAGASDVALPLTFSWSPTAGLSCPTCDTTIANPSVTTSYVVTVTNDLGCVKRDTITIKQRPNHDSVIEVRNPSHCFYADGYIRINGFDRDSNITINYYFNGVLQTFVGTASATGVITIPSLGAGTYLNFTVIGSMCLYNVIPMVILTDPATPPIPLVSSNGPVCEGDNLNIYGSDGNPGVGYNWVGPNGFTSTLANPIIPAAVLGDSGKYVLTVDSLNCRNKDSMWVVISPLPHPYASSNAPFCEVADLQLSSGSTNGATHYSWAGPNAYSSTEQNPVLTGVNVSASGIYTITTLLNNCRATATTTVTIWPIPPVPTVSDTAYCQYSGVPALHAAGTSLLWYTDAVGGVGVSTAPLPSTAVPGTFTWYVNQTSLMGCIGPRTPISAMVSAYPSPYITESDSTICSGTGVTFVAGHLGEGNTGLVWSFGVTDTVREVNPLIHGFTTPGTYPVTLTAFYDICPDTTLYLSLNVYSTPTINLGPDTTICEGSGAIELYDITNATNTAATWVWNTGAVTPNITLTVPGSYYSTVSVDGCTASDTVNVLMDCFVAMPNVFTPNGDGLNDYFLPRALLSRGLTAFKMDIFNRWGTLIFSTNKVEGLGWDGRYNGEMQPEGVFIYNMDATFKDGKKEHHQGNFTLLK